jgi:superfamily II DNA/RNA helicase
LEDPSLDHHLGDDDENKHENVDISEEARRVSTSPPLLHSNSLPGLKPSAGTTLVLPANPYARGGGAAAATATAAATAGGNSIANQGTNTNTNPFLDLWNSDETTNHRNTLNDACQTNQPKRGTYANSALEKYFDPTQSHNNTTASQSIDTTNTFNQRQSTNGLRHELHANGNHHHPWSERMAHHLRRTFRIEQFRDHQEEIINVTMQGHDSFVVMRTGGGKSLTYQLPAVIESESRSRKVTVVISPLISLIRDQEEQMNQLIPGSAVSFTSNMAGGTSEHARRWGLVRDVNGGVALIFVTPEKVGMSTKFKGEMEKLHNQGRLGRFVVDECHCAW